jgi:hypothetical protein
MNEDRFCLNRPHQIAMGGCGCVRSKKRFRAKAMLVNAKRVLRQAEDGAGGGS